jgi:hypothetical protein
MMHVVVNHLHLREPFPEALAEQTQEVLGRVVKAGGLAAHLAKVDDRHLILILMFASAEDTQRVARDVGGPWMREHMVPLLASDTERSVAEIVATAEV